MIKNVWFTSDHHFSHRNIIEYCKRPFSSVEEMDELMVYRWNEYVKPNDTVYYLGDFCMGRTMEDAEKHFKRLNGKVYLVEGNHDAWTTAKAFFPNTKESYVQKLEQQHLLKVDGEKIILSHYPMRSWYNSHYGSWHLYGHVHGALPDYGLSIDVGVDTNDFYPYSFEQVRDIMKKRYIEQRDYVIFKKEK